MKSLLSAVKSLSRNNTVRVVLAALVCLGSVLFFQNIPKALRWPVRVSCLFAVIWLILITIQTVRKTAWTGKKLLFSLILGSFCYGLLFLCCHVFIRLMSARDDRISTRVIDSLAEQQRMGIAAMLDGTSYEMYDREVGWVPRPGHGSDGATISQQGVRSLRDYAIPPDKPEKRLLCVGDSFTWGNNVSDTETYPSYAEQLLPGTEWINLGISGACLTQSILHYRKAGKKFGGKYVVIGFMTDDAKRTVNCFRPFLTPYNPFTKPFAKYSNGVFSIEPNPYQDISDFKKLLANEGPEIQRLLKIDYLTWSNQVTTRNPILRTARYVYEAMQVDRSIDRLLEPLPGISPLEGKKNVDPYKRSKDPYGRLIWNPAKEGWTMTNGGGDPYGRAIWNPDSPGFMALTRVFDLFYTEIIADGRVPLIVIIPGPLDVENHSQQLPRLYKPLMDHFKANQYSYLDFLDPLVAKHQADLSYKALFGARHFLAPINKELAEEIIKALRLP